MIFHFVVFLLFSQLPILPDLKINGIVTPKAMDGTRASNIEFLSPAFLVLSPELRLMIYGHVFDDSLKRIEQHPLRGVCRHIHDEVNLELLRIMTTTISTDEASCLLTKILQRGCDLDRTCSKSQCT